MFTGIVEEMGTVRDATGDGTTARLVIDCRAVIADAHVGDSISVNGCCLTVTALPGTGFAADVMGESLARTGLGDLRPGDRVNLERAMRADQRLGGHLVQGHVDATATVVAVDPHGEWTEMRFTLPDAIRRYVAEKGSVTVEGASLTVMGVDDMHFWVGLIPHTLQVTVLGHRRVGERVNVEADVVAKYVERLLAGGAASPYDTGGRSTAATAPTIRPEA